MRKSMVTINILTNGDSPNAKAFNWPLLLTKDIFAEKGYKITFCRLGFKSIFSSDILFINSKVFTPYWKDKGKIFDFLVKSHKKRQKIIWFDTADSTWSTQFEVLPYVNLYLKNQIFNDKTLYLKKYRTGRIFTDYFDTLYDSKEHSYEYCIPGKKQLSKIHVSWNTCFENYNESRFNRFEKGCPSIL